MGHWCFCANYCSINFNLSMEIWAWAYKYSRIVSSNQDHVRIKYRVTCNYKIVKVSYIFSCSLPWNRESIVGYIGEVVTDILIFDAFIFIIGHLFLLFISLCIYIFTFNKMFGSFVSELDDNSTELKKKIEIIQKLIEFHVDIKGCVCEIKY